MVSSPITPSQVVMAQPDLPGQDEGMHFQPPLSEAVMLHFFSVKRSVPEPVFVALRTTSPAATIVDPAAEAAPPTEHECGWFNSSFELRLGLLVQELPGPSQAH